MTPALEPWQERVVAEKRELDDRLGRLTGFIGTAAFARMHFFDRHLMGLQHEHMAALSNILQQRIERFGADHVAADTDSAAAPREAAPDSRIREVMLRTRAIHSPLYASAFEAGWRAGERNHGLT